MSPERWKQIEDLLQTTLELPEQSRMGFLRHACGEDHALEEEVQSLIIVREQAGRFLEKPAIEVAAYAFECQKSPEEAPLAGLKTGRVVSHYRIEGEIGSGGMGVVYKAQDIRLHRWVALKFLPHRVAHDRQALARFQREARAASSLSHPNICTVYDIGEEQGHAFIAMEYLEGATLKQRLSEGPLPLSLMLTLSLEITDALEAAHSKGIVHRDIKVANILITPQGHAKVLDFGLAKISSPRLAVADATEEQATLPGTTMGTVAYMSPEQASCEDLDSRTDLFSFGAVLYEMATGRQAFGGPSTALVFDAILNRNPSQPTLLRPDLPARLDEIIAKALEKDRTLRYQQAADIHRDLERLKHDLDSERTDPPSASSGGAASPAVLTRRPRRLAVALGIAAVALAAAIYFAFRQPAQPYVSGYFQVTHDGLLKSGFTDEMAGTSPPLVTDGPRLYFTEGSPRSQVLAQVSAAGGETGVIPTSIGLPQLLDISPDRSMLLVAGFTSSTAAPLWSVPVPAGTARPLASLRAFDATWSPDGREIAYVDREDLYRCRSDGTDTRKIVHLPGTGWQPRWSPDGGILRITIFDKKSGFQTLWEVAADGTRLHSLLPGWNAPPAECCGSWTPDGKYFVFQSTRNEKTEIWAIRDKHTFLDFLSRSQSTPFQLTSGQINSRSPVMSPDGKKLYVVGQLRRGEAQRWDLKTQQWMPVLGGISAELVEFSRDGQWITYVSFPEGTLWRCRNDGTDRLQLTFAPFHARGPLWSPDGKYISFGGGGPDGRPGIYKISFNGGTPERLTNGEHFELAPNWSPDGQSVAFSYAPFIEKAPETLGVFILNLRTHQKQKLPASEEFFSPAWSPDGRYMAAVSIQNGTLAVFDFQTRKWAELSSGHAGVVHWSHDGKFLYYEQNGKDPAIMRIRISDRRVERVVSLSGIRQAGFMAGLAFGLSPDGSPIILRDTGTEEVYSLDWQTN